MPKAGKPGDDVDEDQLAAIAAQADIDTERERVMAVALPFLRETVAPHGSGQGGIATELRANVRLLRQGWSTVTPGTGIS